MLLLSMHTYKFFPLYHSSLAYRNLGKRTVWWPFLYNIPPSTIRKSSVGNIFLFCTDIVRVVFLDFAPTMNKKKGTRGNSILFEKYLLLWYMVIIKNWRVSGKQNSSQTIHIVQYIIWSYGSITDHNNLQSYKGLCSRGDGNTQFPDPWMIVLDMISDWL